MSRNTLIAIIILLLVLCCLCAMTAAGVTLYTIGSMQGKAAPTALPTRRPTPSLEKPPLSTPEPEVAPTRPSEATPVEGTSTPIPTIPVGMDTESQLRAVVIPTSDPRDLAARFKPELGEVPLVVNATPPSYEVGDVKSFWISNTDTDQNSQVDAELVVKSDNLYMWVEEGEDVNLRALRNSADLFDKRIYPTNRKFFGSEWTPGVDNDPRLHILHATGLGGSVAGYYSSADEVSSKINPYSNEKEMFYVNLDNNEPGTEFYNATLAHEFQHMIHWNEDKNESTWMNEGASELATQLNDLARSEDSVRPDEVFSSNPDVQLNTWPDQDREDSYAHYGNAYLFLNYFLSRFGDQATQALVADSANGMESVDNVLTQIGAGMTADQIFGDWVIANWLDNPSLGEGHWGYPDYDPEDMKPSKTFNRLPAEGSGDVHQYAADYVSLPGSQTATINFQGVTTNKLAPTDAYSGQWAWWSNNNDESDTRLTLPVDLTGVDKATLRYRVWYDIEEFWDYAYVTASTDGGVTWQPMETQNTTTENPQGNAYGPGYTGVSGGSTPEWVEESVDLTPYAGETIQLRFEYVTDAAVTLPGMFIDDVEIPEIGYSSDFENGAGDWQSEGWLLTNNQLTQNWLVQAITTTADGTVQVSVVPVGPDGRGELNLDGLDRRKDIILAISALAPATTETATYEYTVTAN